MTKFVALGDPSPLLKKSLVDRGYSVIDLPRFSLLSDKISYHADMLFSFIRGRLFTSSSYYISAKSELDLISDSLGASIVLDPHSDFNGYPSEARFNVLLLGDYLFANKNAVSPYIADACDSLGVTLVHVNQGYAACSCAVCGDGIITADPSIYEALVARDIPSLKISQGHILLPGYSYGFIGGACGFSRSDNTLWFNGDITMHPDYNAISQFACSMGVSVYSLGAWSLTDCGGLFFF